MAESRDLRYFVAVADRLSFSRAAEDLPLSQSALSEAIRRLEMEIGTRLLRRNSRRVELTPVGEVLLEDAGELLAHLDHAIDRAQRAGRGEVGRLRVGFEASGAGELSTLARARFGREHPAVRVEPKRFDWGGEAAGVRQGDCDVAFVWLPNDLSGLEVEEVTSERRYAGLPKGHRLARTPCVSIMDLKDEPIMWTRRAPRLWVDWWAVNPRPEAHPSSPVVPRDREAVEAELGHDDDHVARHRAPWSTARDPGRMADSHWRRSRADRRAPRRTARRGLARSCATSRASPESHATAEPQGPSPHARHGSWSRLCR